MQGWSCWLSLHLPWWFYRAKLRAQYWWMCKCGVQTQCYLHWPSQRILLHLPGRILRKSLWDGHWWMRLQSVYEPGQVCLLSNWCDYLIRTYFLLRINKWHFVIICITILIYDTDTSTCPKYVPVQIGKAAMRLLLFFSRTNSYKLHVSLKRCSCYDGVRRETLGTIYHVIVTPTSIKVPNGLRYDHFLCFGVKSAL